MTATPTFFVNGRMVEGALPFAAFKNIIDPYVTLRRPPGTSESR